MIDEKMKISDLANGDLWAGWFQQIQVWASEYLFNQDTLIEVSLIVIAASVAWPLAVYLHNRIKSRGEKFARNAVLQRLWLRLEKLSFPIVWLVLQWLVIASMSYLEFRHTSLVVTSSLLTAWIVISIATVFVANPLWSLTIAIAAWIVAALNIVGLLDNTMTILDNAAITFGQVNVSVLTIVQGLLALGVLLWVTTIIGHLIDGRIKSSPNMTPSMKVLSIKLVRIVLAVVAVVFALRIVGIDLTAFAVVGGAVGLGLGFGLQKIFANLVSGFILLIDKSIKPGDVIAIADYYGRVESLGARYVSVLTRDGVEHLIPNEELITTRVENWSHSQNLLRIRKTIGVHYKSDVKKAIALCLEAAAETPRILKEPAAVCHLQDFGDSSVNLEMRIWIDDPMNGRANVLSGLQLRVWDKFHENDIEIPYPQRDLHLRSSSVPFSQSRDQEDEI